VSGGWPVLAVALSLGLFWLCARVCVRVCVCVCVCVCVYVHKMPFPNITIGVGVECA
jgi:hypothetical protein